MRLSEWRRWPVPLPVRVVLVAEVAVYLAALAAYVWFAMPAGRAVYWYHVVLLGAAVAFPVAANLLHGDRPRDSGLRLGNLAASAKLVVPATLVMAAGVTVTGLVVGGFHWISWRRLAELAGGYLSWGLAQQYLLQSFALRRLMQAGLPAVPAAVLAAGAFAMVHAPNWILVGLTGGAGLVWCAIFLRRPNILTLALAHGALAVLLFHAWPTRWLQNLTIGPFYIMRCKGL